MVAERELSRWNLIIMTVCYEDGGIGQAGEADLVGDFEIYMVAVEYDEGGNCGGFGKAEGFSNSGQIN